MEEKPKRATLSVALITLNEEANLLRTLESVKWADEIVVVDSGSADRTCEIARQFGAKVFVEEWKGFAAQKNSALDKCSGDWILSLDADEEAGSGMRELFSRITGADADHYSKFDGLQFSRLNYFLGQPMKWGGYKEKKLRMFRRGKGRVKDVPVHEVVVVDGRVGTPELDFKDLDLTLIHRAYPTLAGYIEHMNKYSSLGAEMALQKGRTQQSIFAFYLNVFIRPRLTFFYNYILRLGFLDGREGLLLHFYHSVYVSWKYAKAWELSRGPQDAERKLGNSASG